MINKCGFPSATFLHWIIFQLFLFQLFKSWTFAHASHKMSPMSTVKLLPLPHAHELKAATLWRSLGVQQTPQRPREDTASLVHTATLCCVSDHHPQGPRWSGLHRTTGRRHELWARPSTRTLGHWCCAREGDTGTLLRHFFASLTPGAEMAHSCQDATFTTGPAGTGPNRPKL